jgi:tetratricopeptide (TPR) repeat protein
VIKFEGAMSASEKKKQARKAKKAELLKANEKKKDLKDTSKPVDDDPDGVKLVEGGKEVLIEEAVKFLGPLLEYSADDVSAWCLGVEVYLRAGKMLLAWRCLKKALAIDAKHPDVYIQSYKFYAMSRDGVEGVVREVLDGQAPVKDVKVIVGELEGGKGSRSVLALVKLKVWIGDMKGAEEAVRGLVKSGGGGILEVVEGLERYARLFGVSEFEAWGKGCYPKAEFK